MLDGASLDFISPAAAEGRLPNFGRILDGGAVMHLATLRPTQAEPVWTAGGHRQLPSRTACARRRSIACGAASQAIDAAARLLLRAGARALRLPRASSRTPPTILTARPLWNILSDHGVSGRA